ncbi:MAG: hypothetical protein ACR2M1_16260 [Gemmatimonadaceae bacterium]
MNINQLREMAQSFTEELSRESYLANSGLKPDAALQAIYNRYANTLSDDALDLCVERFTSAAEGSEEHRAARMMLEWEVESRVGQVLAPLEEREIALEHSAVIRTPDGGEIPYARAAIDIANTRDRAERNSMEAARAAVAKSTFAPLRLERLQRERDEVEQLHLAPGYNATFELLSGVSLTDLAAQCAAFLRDTQPMWEDVLGERLKAFGVPRAEATRADALALFRLREYDDAFPESAMEETIRRNCADMSLDATAHGHITFDIADRPGKRSRAFCSPVRVPQEVYLVLRPHGGQSDYSTFLHELGHALHFGYARADYPFEYRWLGDNSVTEAYAMLFDHRMQDRAWLLRYSGLGKARVDEFLRLAAFEELHFLRRYCAKLIYEVQVYGGSIPWAAIPDLYVTSLTDATGFQYRAADAFIDLDPRYYSTRYLRAWQLQAVLNETLTERFNDDWWRNPATGPWMVSELFGEGQRESAHELAQRAAGVSISFAPLIKRVESLIAA